jgi:hypothetical protein
MHGVAGETLRLPLHGADSTSASSPTLYELRGGCRAVDAAASLAMVDGVLELRSLLPGDYELCLPMLDARIAVAVTAGVAHGSWFVSPTRALRSEGRSLTDPFPMDLGEPLKTGKVRVELTYDSADQPYA